MMTIKEFAWLCSCNTQTLRYYDRVNLLKPAKTDEMTGYRYYSENQAMDFVKIKNLQSADFSIDEIKQLILKDDDQMITGEDNVLIAIDSLDGSSLKETIYIGKEDTSFRMNEESSLNQFENVWEKHEWKNVSDWLDEVPPLSMDYQYTFFLEVTNKKENADLTFPMCLIASMIIKNDEKMINVGCDVSQSPDEFNHVKLYRVN